MTIATWPETVNLNIYEDGYSEAPEKNIASFQPEVGPPKERRRSSISSDVLTCTGQYTSDEWDNLMIFYRATLLDGTQPFSRLHPRTKAEEKFKFVGDPPKISQAREPIFVGQFTLRRMP